MKSLICILAWVLTVPAALADGTSLLDKAPGEVETAQWWREYRAWREAGALEQAREAALRLLARAGEEHGAESTEAGRAMAELGVTEVLLERYDEAIVHLDQAEALLSDNLPLYSEDLIAPMTFMGVALQAAGRHDQALSAFARARHITHRLWGAENDTQTPIVHAEAESHQALGDLHQAEQLRRFAHRLGVVNHGIDHRETIKAAADLGTWLRSVGDYNGAIAWFHEAIEAVLAGGPDRPEIYPLLYGMAHAFRGGFRGRFARSAYERMLALVDDHPQHFDAADAVRVRVEFGDWLMQRYYEPRAVDMYQAAWQRASDAGLADWLDWLAQPALVRYDAMAPTDFDEANRFIDFSFDLTADGRPRKVRVTDHGTRGRDRAEARKLFPDVVRFRPPIIDGQAEARQDQTITLYLLPPGTALEPPSITPPGRLTAQAGGLGPNLRTLTIDDVRKPVGIDQYAQPAGQRTPARR